MTSTDDTPPNPDELERLRGRLPELDAAATKALDAYCEADSRRREVLDEVKRLEAGLPPPPPPPLEWRGQLQGDVRARGRVLALIIANKADEWAGIAIETDVDTANSLEAIFAAHAHKIVGHFSTPAAALAASEAYARAWHAGDAAAMLAACSCSDIVLEESPEPIE